MTSVIMLVFQPCVVVRDKLAEEKKNINGAVSKEGAAVF